MKINMSLLMDALIKIESGGNPKAVSPVGAIGLCQIMPRTGIDIAKQLGVSKYDLFNPVTNRRFGTFYFTWLLTSFKDVELALAAYNGGIGTIQRALKKYKAITFKEIQPFLTEETALYVPKVMKVYHKKLSEIKEV